MHRKACRVVDKKTWPDTTMDGRYKNGGAWEDSKSNGPMSEAIG